MHQMGGGEGEAEIAAMAPKELGGGADQQGETAAGIGKPEQKEREAGGDLQGMAGAQLSGAEDRQNDCREDGVRSESRSHPPQDGRCPHSTGRRLKPALCRRRRGRGPTMGHHSTRHPAVSHVLTLLKDCKFVNYIRSMPISMYSGPDSDASGVSTYQVAAGRGGNPGRFGGLVRF